KVSDETFSRAFPNATNVVSLEREDLGATFATAGGGGTWWFLGLAMLIGMVLETILAWRFGRRA
ncbi:MAG: hypothetical protein KDB80_15295, partial [Planctomycetes bacterium]|nr:hypothetical protein [Planctomycetota bacterium]